MAELGVLQPAVHQVGAGVDLVEVFGMVGAVPFVGQVVEAVGLGDLVVFVAVPRHKVAHIERVQLRALFGRGSQRQGQVVFGHAVAHQLFHREADRHAIFDLIHGGIRLLIGAAAVFKADVLAIAQHGGVELGCHVQREGIDQAVHIPGGLAVFFKELAHQHFLGADVGLAADDGAAEFLADVFQVMDAGLHELIGEGHMMITVIPEEGERYQGVVALDGDTLAACLEKYFAQSEQLATRIWIKTEPHDELPKAAGMLLQVMPDINTEQHALDFEHVTTLTDTIKSEELLTLSAQEVLYRLYHQEEVRLFDPQPVSFVCNCSRARCEAAILQIGKAEVDSLLEEQNEIKMDCDYCGTEYHFSAEDLAKIFNDQLTPPEEPKTVLH